ncbi:SDR family oxidoreductase [Gluconacetobacter sacchari]|uniref:SDR family oxidoreductase n=2 Tax=Gluconacetobacter sacchari TaxID=92759 RepID=A0A7W4IG52_9PROT|nr:SDR family oxidoreductase [Gluconacetobacter sacchari]MBB2162249.1 SDR family oxidoreductase [Gluconacetobacter sacchari]GBQ22486.1 dehydrogenase [Gluconacetobacter sacchari DSM 12717]
MPFENVPDPGALAGRRIVITGAARGLGEAIARACAAMGATLWLADILDGAGRRTAETIAGDFGKPVHFSQVDLSDADSIAAFGCAVRDMWGETDGLVNNGAIATNVGGKRFEEIDIGLWDRVQRVNVRGTWLMTRALSPLFSRRARIVNLASDTALWGAPNLLAYTASKGAVIAMTRSLSRELGPRGIGIAAVAPGIVRTEATEYVPKQRHDLYENGRAVPGPQDPDDIVGVVGFLLTDYALALTGQVLPVNAGFVFT